VQGVRQNSSLAKTGCDFVSKTDLFSNQCLLVYIHYVVEKTDISRVYTNRTYISLVFMGFFTGLKNFVSHLNIPLSTFIGA
jgi:hypothetical protein